jgi:hypothetical protein
MKPWGKVSSIRGANTLFEGQQINGHTEKRNRREIKDADKGRSKQQIQRGTRQLRDKTSQGPGTL